MKSKILETYGLSLFKGLPYKIGEFLESADGETTEDIENEIRNIKWKLLKTVLFIYYKKDVYELSITTDLHSDNYKTAIGFFKNQILISGSNDDKTIFVKDKLFRRKLSRIVVKNYFGSVYYVLSSKMTNEITQSVVIMDYKRIKSEDIYVSESADFDIRSYNLRKINRYKLNDHISVHAILFDIYSLQIIYNNYANKIISIESAADGDEEFKVVDYEINGNDIILKDYLPSLNLIISVDGYVITNK